jgi:hypothetical protein
VSSSTLVWAETATESFGSDFRTPFNLENKIRENLTLLLIAKVTQLTLYLNCQNKDLKDNYKKPKTHWSIIFLTLFTF